MLMAYPGAQLICCSLRLSSAFRLVGGTVSSAERFTHGTSIFRWGSTGEMPGMRDGQQHAPAGTCCWDGWRPLGTLVLCVRESSDMLVERRQRDVRCLHVPQRGSVGRMQACPSSRVSLPDTVFVCADPGVLEHRLWWKIYVQWGTSSCLPIVSDRGATQGRLAARKLSWRRRSNVCVVLGLRMPPSNAIECTRCILPAVYDGDANRRPSRQSLSICSSRGAAAAASVVGCHVGPAC